MRIVYLAGAGRSGSTLLTRLAGQCQGFVAVGELRHLGITGALTGNPGQKCTCGETFNHCSFWRSVADGLIGLGRDPRRYEPLRAGVDRIRHIPRILRNEHRSAFARRRDEFLSYLKDIYELTLAESGASVVIDSSKDPSFLFLLLQMPGTEVDVVHLVRDPRAVAYSWTTKKAQPEILETETYMPTYGMSRSAAFWSVTNLLAELGGRRANRYCRIRYEDLVKNPAAGVGAVLGLNQTEIPLLRGSVAEFHHPEHHIGGNPDRFQTGRVEISEDRRWRERIRRSENLVVSLFSFPLMVRYGYPWSSNSNG